MNIIHGRQLNATATAGLNARQAAAVLWTAEGKTKEEVSMIMGVSVRQARRYIEDAMERLEAHNLPHLVTRAIDAGVLRVGAHLLLVAITLGSALQAATATADDGITWARTRTTRTRTRSTSGRHDGGISWDPETNVLIFPTEAP